MLLALALLVSAPAAAEVDAAVTVAAEYDSNARRLPDPPRAAPVNGEEATLAPGSEVVPDGLLRVEGALFGRLLEPGFALTFDGALGGKLFFDEADERMAVAQALVVLDSALPAGFLGRLSTFSKVRGQASGRRTYGLTRSEALLSRPLPFDLVLRGGLVGQAFHSGDTPLFSSFGGGPAFGARYALTDKEHLDGHLEAQARCFPFARAVDRRGFFQPIARCDAPLRASLTLTSARRVFVSAGYLVERNLSNSFGEAYIRHRLHGMVATRLPFTLTCALRGAVQLTRYDEGISLGQRLFLAEDDESQNTLQLLISRPWFGGLEVQGRLSFYGNELAKGGVRFSRTTASLGLRAEL